MPRCRPDFASLREQLRAIAGALEEQESVPAIKAQMVLIQSVAGEEWWNDVTVAMLETARKRLRALVKLIEKTKRKIVHTDFIDELGTETPIALAEVDAGMGMDLARFRIKARQFLKVHENHVSLQRLRRNQALTAYDLVDLERMLVDAGGSQQLIDEASLQSHGLGSFIRSLVGLDWTGKRQGKPSASS